MDIRTWMICWDVFGSYFDLAGVPLLIRNAAREAGM